MGFLARLLTGTAKPTPGVHSYREMAAMRHPVDDFLAGDGIEWIALRVGPKPALAAWSRLIRAKRVRRKVAEQSPPVDYRTHWVVFQFAGSPWSQLCMVQGDGVVTDRHLRELSLRTGGDALLLYGRNDHEKCRALAAIHYRGGEPRETLLLGADEDQDLLLDHLELDDSQAGDVQFDFDFDDAPRLAKEFLTRHGLADRDLAGELARMDVLIR